VTRKLREIMSPAPACLASTETVLAAARGPDDDVNQAARLVRERVVRRIPVLQDGIPVGVVAVGDLAPEAPEAPEVPETGESVPLPAVQAVTPDS